MLVELARRLDRLALEAQELKALYADPNRRGALRSRAWREAYEQTVRETPRRESKKG